jgi:hypothetical protein
VSKFTCAEKETVKSVIARLSIKRIPERESIYGVAYISIPRDFDFYRPVFEKMVDTFQIYAKGPVIQEDNSSSSVP